MSPPVLLMVSSFFSMVGLYLLSGSAGSVVFVAFVVAFFHPTKIGFVVRMGNIVAIHPTKIGQEDLGILILVVFGRSC